MKHIKTYNENIKRLLDEYGEIINKDDDVVIPEPNEDDSWSNGDFTARVDKINTNTGNIVVVDMDDEYFEIEADRVEVVDYDYNEWSYSNMDKIKELGEKKAKEYYKDMIKYNI